LGTRKEKKRKEKKRKEKKRKKHHINPITNHQFILLLTRFDNRKYLIKNIFIIFDLITEISNGKYKHLDPF